MIRLLIYILVVFFIFPSCKRSPVSDVPFSALMEPGAALNDYRLFRVILEKSHPGLSDYLSTQQRRFLFDSVYSTINEKITLRYFYNKLAFITNETGCSHTFTTLPPFIIDSLNNQALLFPFPVVLIDGELIANSDHVVPHGTKILSINNIPVARIMDSMAIYNSVEGKHRETQKIISASAFGLDYFARFGGFKRFDVFMKDTSGRFQTSSLDAITLIQLDDRKADPYYFDATDVNYSLSINEYGGYAVFRLTDFNFFSANKQNAFEDFLENSFELLATKKDIQHLIIDLRENTGGNLYYCFLLYSYLSKTSFHEYKSVSSKIQKVEYENALSEDYDESVVTGVNSRLKEEFTGKNKDGYFIPDSLISTWDPNPHRFSGKIYIITNHQVASSASYFISLIKNNPGATVIGYETCGGGYSSGGFKTLRYRLPASQIGFQFPYARFVYSSDEAKSGRGILPDYIVEDSYQSFITNKDRQLNFIIDSLLIKNK